MVQVLLCFVTNVKFLFGKGDCRATHTYTLATLTPDYRQHPAARSCCEPWVCAVLSLTSRAAPPSWRVHAGSSTEPSHSTSTIIVMHSVAAVSDVFQITGATATKLPRRSERPRGSGEQQLLLLVLQAVEGGQGDGPAQRCRWLHQQHHHHDHHNDQHHRPPPPPPPPPPPITTTPTTTTWPTIQFLVLARACLWQYRCEGACERRLHLKIPLSNLACTQLPTRPVLW
jgi:hypothetical protein